MASDWARRSDELGRTVFKGQLGIDGSEAPETVVGNVAASPSTCWHCKTMPAVSICCSSHNKLLCHNCYRVTHFVEICGEGCPACATEGLPRVLA